MIKFVQENPSSAVSLYILYKYLSGEVGLSSLKNLISIVDTSLRKSTYYKLIEGQMTILSKTEVGKPAIDFSMTDVNGNKIQLSSLYGKYLLIDFWASWCPSCRQENPNVVSVFNEYSSKGFSVLGVSLDNNKEHWLKAINDDKLVWKQVSDLKRWDNEAAKLYGIRSIPSNLLLNPQGIIIAKNLRGKELKSKLGELLK